MRVAVAAAPGEVLSHQVEYGGWRAEVVVFSDVEGEISAYIREFAHAEGGRILKRK